MWDITPKKTPMITDTCLSIDDCNYSYMDLTFHKKYRGIVGCIGWLNSMTRPDLSYVYSSLPRYVQFPGQAHMDAALHALAYLHGSLDQGLVYTKSLDGPSHERLWGWVDADYAGCGDTRKSHTVYVLMLNGDAIS